MELFDKIIPYLFELEGFESNDPDDPGKETRYGISKAAHPDVDIKNLTPKKAKGIYRECYWKKFGCDRIQSAVLAAELFVAVVNINGYIAVRYLQKACNDLGANLKEDGIMGAGTLSWINNYRHPKAVVSLFEKYMADHYRTRSKKKYLAGLLIRNDTDFEG